MLNTNDRFRGGPMHRLRRALRRLCGDPEGATLVEFAFVAPILVFLLLGGIEIARFVLLNQKLNRLASNTSDLVTRSETMSEDEIDNIFTAGEFITSPFQLGAEGVVIISSVSNSGPNDTDPPFVIWQETGAGTGSMSSAVGDPGMVADLPDGLSLRAGQDIIVAEVIYDYEPFLFGDVTGDQQLYHISIHRPRFGPLTTLIPAGGGGP